MKSDVDKADFLFFIYYCILVHCFASIWHCNNIKNHRLCFWSFPSTFYYFYLFLSLHFSW